MFDVLLLKIECPLCKKTKTRDVQTKAFKCLLDEYKIGDTINGSVKNFQIGGITDCKDCSAFIYVRCYIKNSKLNAEYKITSVEKKPYKL